MPYSNFATAVGPGIATIGNGILKSMLGPSCLLSNRVQQAAMLTGISTQIKHNNSYYEINNNDNDNYQTVIFFLISVNLMFF